MPQGDLYIRWEKPVCPRPHEMQWDFTHAFARASIDVSSEGVLGELVTPLAPLEEACQSIVLECTEILERPKVLEEFLRRSVSYVDPNKWGWAELQEALRTNVLVFPNGSAAWTERSVASVRDAFEVLSPLEWYGSFWKGNEYFSLICSNVLFERRDRLEQAFIEKLSVCEAVFFMAPNHRNLEAVLSERVIERFGQTAKA